MSNSYQKLPSLEYDGDQMSEVTDTSQLLNDGTSEIRPNAFEAPSKYSNYCCNHRVEKHKNDSYRKGPAPIEDAEALKKSVTKATYGTLDSDVEDLEFEEIRKNGSAIVDQNPYNKVKPKTNAKGDSLASCRALIVYFSKLAKTKDDDETVDLNFVDSLLQNGADINFPDKHGQTVMHEISRGWHPDVAQFAIQNGADVNKADGFGRTPLHLAAAVDYDDMVEFLVQNGANLGAKTFGENQTPMHYAAKNNAAASLKIMLRLGAHINDRDYKGRTPLFVAAETARADAARYLIEQGAPAGVYDSSGTTCLSLMIEKMPQIAIEAVEQFHLLDRAFRKHYYYLSYLEPDPKFLADAIPESKRERKEQKERMKEEKRLMKEQGKKVKKQKTYAKTPLEVIVQYNQLDLVMHPVFQRLLHVKWNLFAKVGSWLNVLLNLFYTLIWTFLGIFIPRGEKLDYYTPFSDNWWRLVLEVIGLALTVYFIFMEISQVRIIEKVHNRWRQWRTRHVEKDLQFCHPRWPEEKKYLESELAQIRTYQRTYFREPWNIFEWIAYFVILTLAITRILSVASNDKTAENIHPRIYSLGLIVIWLRFMRSCRAFRSLGPFIAILGSVIADTMKFAFLFFEFFIPYVVGFWILFGGPHNGDKMGDDSRINWEKFNNLVYSVWTMTLMGDFDFDGLVAVDRLMAQILCGSYFALAGVICMNLYIALLSDTFARVYSQAQANAVMQLAQTVILLEGKLGKEKRLKFAHYLQDECSPEEVYSRDEGNLPDDHGNDLFEKVTRHIVNRIDEMEDNVKRATGASFHNPPGSPSPGGGNNDFDSGGGGSGPGGSLMPIFKRHDKQIDGVKKDLNEIKMLLQKLTKVPPQAKQPAQVTQPPPLTQQPPAYIPPNQAPLYPTPSAFQQSPSLYPPQQRPRGAGYMSDPEYGYPPPVVQGRGRKKRRGGKGPGSGYESDNYSVQSEMVPKHRIQRPRSPESIKSMPAGNKKRKNKKNQLTGSWEDIRAEFNA